MTNNEFPPLEQDKDLTEVFPEIPGQMEPLEDLPVVEELSFEQEATEPEIQVAAEEPVIDEIPVIVEMDPVEEPSVLEEVVQPEETEIQEIPSVAEPIFEVTAFVEDPSVEVPQMEVTSENLETAEDFSEEIPAAETELENTEPEEEILDQEYLANDQSFDSMMKPPEPEPEKPQFTMSSGNYKGRPKRKKGEGLLGIPSILATFVWLALIVIIGVTAGRMLWICAADVLAFGREDKVVTVTVYESDTMEDIVDKLHAGGLIRYKSLFNLYAGISDAQEDIKPGIYDLNTRYDYHALVNFMSPRSSREVIKLTIPEGYTCRQIFSLLEENRICTAKDAAAYAANGELSEYWFLEGLERGAENCLEGYLFPDTYEFYKNSTPREAIERMLDNFEYRFDEDMLAKLENLNKKVTDGSYGIREIVIIASLIEKESAAPGESPMVSGVIYNRLFKWGNNRPLLNIDASIVYAQEGQNERIDTKLDHPYNTYLYEGLTPGPIANPGLASLKAALNPESHNYYYYVLNPETGMHQFSTTYEEHQGYVRQFNASVEVEIE